MVPEMGDPDADALTPKKRPPANRHAEVAVFLVEDHPAMRGRNEPPRHGRACRGEGACSPRYVLARPPAAPDVADASKPMEDAASTGCMAELPAAQHVAALACGGALKLRGLSQRRDSRLPTRVVHHAVNRVPLLGRGLDAQLSWALRLGRDEALRLGARCHRGAQSERERDRCSMPRGHWERHRRDSPRSPERQS
jgi:hypothetical protein